MHARTIFCVMHRAWHVSSLLNLLAILFSWMAPFDVGFTSSQHNFLFDEGLTGGSGLQGSWIARSSVMPWHRRRSLGGMCRGEGPLGVSMLAKNKSKKKPVRNKFASFCHLPVECVRVMRPAFSHCARSVHSITPGNNC